MIVECLLRGSALRYTQSELLEVIGVHLDRVALKEQHLDVRGAIRELKALAIAEVCRKGQDQTTVHQEKW